MNNYKLKLLAIATGVLYLSCSNKSKIYEPALDTNIDKYKIYELDTVLPEKSIVMKGNLFDVYMDYYIFYKTQGLDYKKYSDSTHFENTANGVFLKFLYQHQSDSIINLNLLLEKYESNKKQSLAVRYEIARAIESMYESTYNWDKDNYDEKFHIMLFNKQLQYFEKRVYYKSVNLSQASSGYTGRSFYYLPNELTKPILFIGLNEKEFYLK